MNSQDEQDTLRKELQRINSLDPQTIRGIIINILKDNPKYIVNLFSDLTKAYTQYAEFTDQQFANEFDRSVLNLTFDPLPAPRIT
ncbi:MAG: hypothetical protein HeimC2_42390 [Candidatus Heimdallarchaeota archaeon LC_2]|nr:MAG: hypothetical protein HeimC2_42390 [Candidatus Heimdallarchaeota archaeon LC_2]